MYQPVIIPNIPMADCKFSYTVGNIKHNIPLKDLRIALNVTRRIIWEVFIVFKILLRYLILGTTASLHTVEKNSILLTSDYKFSRNTQKNPSVLLVKNKDTQQLSVKITGNSIQTWMWVRKESTWHEYLLSLTESLIFNLAFHGRSQHQRCVRYGSQLQ